MPHYTSARINYAELLTLEGRYHESMAQLNLARLYDPLSPSVHLARAICMGYQRRYDTAREAYLLCRAAGESSLWTLTSGGMNELYAGNLNAAAALLEEAAARFSDMPTALLARACLDAARGDADRARAIVHDCTVRFPFYAPANHSVVTALLRDREATLLWLGKALEVADMTLLAATMSPALDWLASDAGFMALRSRCPVWARRKALPVA